ncbi:MAG TPA: dihydropteroate synthase [Myxococcota bacterium]|nr:dihydropteroate synthase [Myxococcota bacterium]HOH77022.1 dihydropteroate synthase [Myxococcota bacterium]HPV04265.1 dihydropteroate synthase [Myxococcota bacterium]
MYALEDKTANIAAAAADGTRPPLLMGILNVTPDSFSDGGDFVNPRAAIHRALQMVEQGADIIDVGGETTRPGAVAVPEPVELSRVIPTVRAITSATEVPVSIDTRRASVAAAAMDAGACIVNDVSGFKFDPGMIPLLGRRRPIAVAMHMRGTPADMQQHAAYASLTGEIIAELMPQLQAVFQAGLPRERLWLDPGIGFSKTATQCAELLSGIGVFAALGFPVLVGPSRKSFIGAITGRTEPKSRIFGTAAAVAAAVINGARIIRVHDVAEMRDVIKVARAIARNVPTETEARL